MEAVFLKLLNMSITGCVMIMAVLIARLLLKKAPRWSICLLWGLVALRLICPFTLESNLSLIHDSEPISQEIVSNQSWSPPVVSAPVHNEVTAPSLPPVQRPPRQNISVTPQRKTIDLFAVSGYVWLSGVVAMLLYTLISYGQLKRMVRTATRLEGNIRQSEYVTSPFVLGVFRPIIYLPYGLKQSHQDHIIAHEQAHIRRGDHLIKPLGFLILSVHWFNPFVWIAYILLCRDIEAACDERVIKEMTKEQRQSYSATLLHYSVKRRRIAACPVAFGETGIKGRIKSVMNYKKPTVWLVVMSILLSCVLAGCFLTDPVQEQLQDQSSVTTEEQKNMDALVDQIASKFWDLDLDSLHPDYYRLIDAQAREELMAYGDTALDYLVNRLRNTQSNVHNIKEQIMVYLCEDLAKVVPTEKRYQEDWATVPGMWLTYFDKTNADKYDKTRLQPGFYGICDILYGEISDLVSMLRDHGQYQYAEFGPDNQYMVTESGLFVRNMEDKYVLVTSAVVEGNGDTILQVNGLPEETEVRIRTDHADYTNAIAVDWNWEASGGENDLWNKIKTKERDGRKERPALSDLLAENDYLYQPLDADHCLIQTGTGLYTHLFLIGQSNGQLQYVYELSKTILS